MKRTITPLLAISAVLFFSSCKREESINIDQDRIHASYEYVYNADKNTSSTMATFRIDNSGGKKIELTYPARVEFNGEGMVWSFAMGNYQLTQSGTQLGGTFIYRDVNDQTYENSISNVSSIELPFGLTSISQNGNFFLPWTGDAIQAGEIVRVTIKGGAQQGSKTWTLSTAGSGHIMLDENRLKELTVGNADILIEREFSTSLVKGAMAGGRLTSKYSSRVLHINITN